MIRVLTTPNAGGGFHLQWYGTLGGSALGTDASPNTSEPAASRVFKVSQVRDGVMLMGGGVASNPSSIKIVIADGTSMTVQMWFYDAARAVWIPFPNQASTLAFANSNLATPGNLVYANMAGCKIFPQITANTGCTVLGFGFC